MKFVIFTVSCGEIPGIPVKCPTLFQFDPSEAPPHRRLYALCESCFGLSEGGGPPPAADPSFWCFIVNLLIFHKFTLILIGFREIPSTLHQMLLIFLL